MCPSGKDEAFRYPNEAADEIGGFRQAFDALDADHDGKISPEDLESLSIISNAEIMPMIAAADTDQNGYVEFEEFEGVLLAGSSKDRVSNGAGGLMEEVFRVMDRDGDGKVGFDDLKEYLQSAAIEIADDEVMSMLRMGGGDETEGVRFENLVRILSV